VNDGRVLVIRMPKSGASRVDIHLAICKIIAVGSLEYVENFHLFYRRAETA